MIDLGDPYSVEMIDLQRPAARANVLREMKTLLDLEAVDELFVNTRSHVQLAAYQGDGDAGIQPLVNYRQARKGYTHLGIDRAYAPISLAEDPVLREWAADPALVERITTWQPGEWEGDCQDPDTRSGGVTRATGPWPMAPGAANRLQPRSPALHPRSCPDGAEAAARPRRHRGPATSDGTRTARRASGARSTIHSIGEGMAMPT